MTRRRVIPLTDRVHFDAGAPPARRPPQVVVIDPADDNEAAIDAVLEILERLLRGRLRP